MERHNAHQATGEEKAVSFVRHRDGDAVDICFQAYCIAQF
jgi:hypothetical protein